MGVGDASAIVSLRLRFGFGKAAGDSAAEGDPTSSAGKALVAASFDTRCFSGDGDSKGVPVNSCDSTRGAQIMKPITRVIESSFMAITDKLGKTQD